MGEKPPGTYLDRKEADKGYSKENCRWATKDQHLYNRNMRSDNTHGLKGLHWDSRSGYWQARDKKNKQLYHGKDFFEACCARKRWEAQYEAQIF